jgi:RimJ/RimL family protein N-acetyltransferase
LRGRNLIRLPLQDGRITLRRLAIEDAEELLLLEADPEVKKFVGGPKHKTLDDVQRSVTRKLAEDDLRQLIVFDSSSNEFLGRSGLLPKGPDELELHCVLKKAAQGRGYGKATFSILISVAEALGKTPVAFIHPENTASLHLFHEFEFIQSGLCEDDGWQNGHLVFRPLNGLTRR